MHSAPSIQKLLDELERLPGVGPKSAQRIAYWLLNADKATALRLAEAIVEVKDTVRFCSRCFNYAEGDLCEICASGKRDGGVLCVVSEPRDIPPIERTGVFQGVYHVLGGALSPMEGIGPDDLHIAELLKRLASEEVREVVLATNPNIEGETTAAYLARLIKPLGITVTRLASGLPVGGDLEFADEVTLGRGSRYRGAGPWSSPCAHSRAGFFVGMLPDANRLAADRDAARSRVRAPKCRRGAPSPPKTASLFCLIEAMKLLAYVLRKYTIHIHGIKTIFFGEVQPEGVPPRERLMPHSALDAIYLLGARN